MAKDGAVFVFCSSCKILYFASSGHPRIATVPHKQSRPKIDPLLQQHPHQSRVHWRMKFGTFAFSVANH